jgi:hypothetical protein
MLNVILVVSIANLIVLLLLAWLVQGIAQALIELLKED